MFYKPLVVSCEDLTLCTAIFGSVSSGFKPALEIGASSVDILHAAK
jgi:hypothetical protein